jgi:hypothetical protein
MSNSGCPICKAPIINETNKRNFQALENNIIQDELNIRNIQNHIEEDNDNNNIINSLYNSPNNNNDNNKFTYKKNNELNLISTYRNIVQIKNALDKNGNIINTNEIGAISYSLPQQLVYNRSFENEILRLELELYNKKILELYENPAEALSKYNLNEQNN